MLEYKIALPLKVTNFFEHPVSSSMLQWFEKALPNGGWVWTLGSKPNVGDFNINKSIVEFNYLIFKFTNEQDAMLFKLVWGGESI